jgi:putative SOS response-associated peptidase YedK
MVQAACNVHKCRSMCGRYAITSAPEAIRKLFGYPEQPNFPPRYNIAPTQPIPIVRLDQGARHFALVRWGLLPSWVEDPKKFSLVINARDDSVLGKPAFRSAMRYRRCLVPADGFYEWQAAGAGPKRPYYIRRKDRAPFAFAGLWEVWTGPNGEEMQTAAIVTTAANRVLRPIHDRMPVMLSPDAFDLWLDTKNVDARTAHALLIPAPEHLIEAYPISTAVNRVANDDASLIAPLDAAAEAQAASPAQPETVAETKPEKPKRKKDDRQPSLF